MNQPPREREAQQPGEPEPAAVPRLEALGREGDARPPIPVRRVRRSRAARLRSLRARLIERWRREPPTYEELVHRLWSYSLRRSLRAAEALGRLDDPRAIPELRRALAQPRWTWRELSGPLWPRPRLVLNATLAHLGDASAIEPLAEFMGGRKRRYVRAAAEALAALARRAQEPGPLVEILALMPVAAQGSLRGALAEWGLFANEQRARVVEQEAVDGLRRLRCPLVAPVIRALRDYGFAGPAAWVDQVRLHTGPVEGHLLNHLADPRAVAPLAAQAARGGERARRCVVEGWSAVARETSPLLLELLDSPDPVVQVWAIAAVSTCHEEHVAGCVSEWLAGQDPSRHLGAALALARQQDPRAIPPLIAALERPEAEVCRAAADALAEMAPLGVPLGAALAPLQAVLADGANDEVERACRRAIRAIRRALREAPTELESVPAPGGSGTELESAPRPAGRGTEMEAADGA